LEDNAMVSEEGEHRNDLMFLLKRGQQKMHNGMRGL